MGSLKRSVRVVLFLLVILTISPVVVAGINAQQNQETPSGDVDTISPGIERDGLTIVTGQHSPHTPAYLAVYAANNSVVYQEEKYDMYFDVDPIPDEPWNITFVAGDELNESECGNKGGCVRNLLVKANLKTGKHWVLFSRDVPENGNNAWHDADRIGAQKYIIGDIFQSQILIVNTTSDLVSWGWMAQSHYSREIEKEKYLVDWTHINDVEYTNRGILVSVRNMDSVVFIDKDHGVNESLTLGSDDNHSVLFEQHNPDYIPKERGGPALLVADSENNRIIEYQWRNGSWVQSWVWQTKRTNWPRDADRLPNGNTLIADTHNDRVVEVNSKGNIVWSVEHGLAYDAERMGTGPESTGGHAASAHQSIAQSSEKTQEVKKQKSISNQVFPNKIVHAVNFATPRWMFFWHVLTLLVGIVTLFVWAGLELRWSGYSAQFPLKKVD